MICYHFQTLSKHLPATGEKLLAPKLLLCPRKHNKNNLIVNAQVLSYVTLGKYFFFLAAVFLSDERV